MARVGGKKAKSPAKTRASSSKDGLKGKVKGENFYHDAKKVKRRKMLSGGKPVYDRDGKVLQAAAFQKTEAETDPGRVQPDRRWFGNTRVISQTALEHFRTSLSAKAHDPYSVLLRRNKLPMALLDDAANPHAQKRSHIVETEPFSETFGPKAQRKRPRLEAGTFEELGSLGAAVGEAADAAEIEAEKLAESGESEEVMPQAFGNHIDPIYFKGTSKRIYGELYKVIDSSDVLLHVLDARDPLGTLCESVLEYIRKEKAHKQVVLIINKCDLVPNWVTSHGLVKSSAGLRADLQQRLLRPWKINSICASADAFRYEAWRVPEAQICNVHAELSMPYVVRQARYIQHLTPRYPTLAFHASTNHSFGKGSLIQLLRQFSQLHSDKKQISVGFIGYPNVGKSSVINTLKSGKVTKVAPIPGETKIWQYITLTRRIYLIDCPGIVPTSANDSLTGTVLKGVVRVEALATPSDHIPSLLTRVKPLYLSRTYDIPLPTGDDGDRSWVKQPEVLLETLARMKGRLLKGGEPDIEGVARIVLSDWVRGRIPYFVTPPERPEELNEEEERKTKKENAKGKSAEKAFVPNVVQKLRGLMQKNTFVGEDVRPLEESKGEESREGEDESIAEDEWTGFGDAVAVR